MRATLRQLEYAIAVAEHRHFRRAAAACHVTQPALSTQIAQLEQNLGVRIFDRNRRRVLVTGAGERILERARACLREAEGLEELAAHLARPGAGPLRLGIIPTISPYLLPALLPRLRARFPDYEVRLWEEQTAPLLEKLDGGELDLAILALPIPGDERRGRQLASEPFVLLAPEDHPLAAIEEPAPDDLAGDDLLLLAEGHCMRGHALSACLMDAPGRLAPMQANSLSMLVQMVRHGMGITLLPAGAIPVELADRSSLVARRFRGEEPSRILGATWRPGNARADELEELCNFISDEARQQVAVALGSL